MQGERQVKGNISAQNGTVTLDVFSLGAIGLQVLGTFTGTLTFQASNDGGTTWVSLLLSNVATGATASSASGAGLFAGSIAGILKVRVNATAWTSGQATVILTAEAMAGAGGGSGGGGGGGAVTVADGADTAEGATTDAAVTGDNTGTISAKLRGLNKLLADVWDSVNHWLKVSIQNSTIAVTQSGSWSVSTSGGGATATLANVAESAASVTLIAANANRLSWSVYNDSDSAVCIKFGATASASSFVIRLLPRDFTSHKDFGGAVYTGIITGIWDSTPGTSGHAAARTMELTA